MRRDMRLVRHFVLLAPALGILSAATACGAVVDLSSSATTDVNQSVDPYVSYNNLDAIVVNINEIPTSGTGAIYSFLRVQSNNKTYDPGETRDNKITYAGNVPGNEQGYNTSIRPITDINNEEANTDQNFTRAILLSDVPVVTIDSKFYLQFLLDLNESKGQSNELLTLNQVQIFLRNGDVDSSTLVGATPAMPPAIAFSGATPIFQLNDVDPTFTQILLNADLNAGSGKGDMFLYVPYDPTWSDPSYQSMNLIFFTQFGDYPASPSGADNSSTFEEWAVLKTGSLPTIIATTPEPASLALWSLGALGCAVAGYRRRRASA